MGVKGCSHFLFPAVFGFCSKDSALGSEELVII